MKIICLLPILLFSVNLANAENLPLQALKSAHGVPYVLLTSDVQNTVAVGIAFKGGIGSDDINGPAVGYLAPGLMSAGAGGKSPSELYEAMQDFGADWSLSSTPDQTYAVLAAPAKGIGGAAKMINMILNHPDFPELKFQQSRNSLAARFEEFAAYPDSKLQTAFVNAVSERHSYLNYSNPTAESVRRVSRADLVPWMAKHITKDGILVSVVGDLDPAKASELVDQILDGLPEKSDVGATPKMIFKNAPSGPIYIAADTGEQAIVAMGTSFQFDADIHEWMASLMLSSIFSGDQKTRLFKDIREGSGATYGLQPDINFAEANTTNLISGRIAKTNTDQTLALIKKSWDNFRENGPTEEEISNAKARILHQLGDMSRNHAAMAGYIRDYLTGHWTASEIAELPSIIESINLRDPKLLAKLFPPNPIIVIAQ